MKKAITLTAALLIFAQLVACGESTLTPAETTTGDTEPVTTDVFNGIGDKKYDGREFNFLIRETEIDDYFIEAESGEVLDDAVYKRNRMVEERFDIRINPIKIDAAWDSRSTYIGTMRNSVMSGSGEYDLIDGYAGVIGDGFADRLFLNLHDVPNLRLDEAWWSSIIEKELTVNGKLYAMTGDLAVNMWSNLFALYFNKQTVEEFKRESPYELVKSGKWTFSVLLEQIKDVARDIDGDGKMTVDDKWGLLVYDTLWFDNLHNAFDIRISKKDSNGQVSLDFQNEKLIDAYEKIVALANDNPDAHFMNQSTPNIIQTGRELFTSGGAMYFGDTLDACTVMRSADIEFGILPLPKYDEKQEGYHTASRDGRTMFVIPADVKDSEFAGRITEALAVASHEYVIPAYYEVTLKTKTARDDDSSGMLDIIRSGFTLDFAAEYAMQTGQSGYMIRNALSSGKSYASFLASNINAYEAGLEKFLKAYE